MKFHFFSLGSLNIERRSIWIDSTSFKHLFLHRVCFLIKIKIVGNEIITWNWRKNTEIRKNSTLLIPLLKFVTDKSFIHKTIEGENGFATNIFKLRANISCIGSSGGFSHKGGYPWGVKRDGNGEKYRRVSTALISFDFSRVNIIPCWASSFHITTHKTYILENVESFLPTINI